MHYGVDLGNMEVLWKRALHELDGSCSARSSDDEKERAFWHGYFEKKTEYCPDEYSRPIAAAVRAILTDKHPDTILEIGPGWGNYTFMLAELCRELTCVDISPDVLRFLQAVAARQRVYNLGTVCAKWEDAVLPQKYSAVFAYNCFYRMLDLKACLEKLHRTAEFHVIGMTSGPEQPFLKEFETELGLRIKWHRFDYIYFTNILYAMGIDVNCRIIQLEKVYEYETLDEAVRRESARILDNEYSQEEVRKIIARYYLPQNGKFRFVHHFCAAILYW